MKAVTVLVVDDESFVRRTAVMILKRGGYEAMEAASGPDAIDLVRSDPDAVGLVLLDMTMPEMNGHETMAALREIRPDLKVVLSSGYASPKATGESGAAPDAFLQKPYQMNDLYALVEKMLAGD